ncbi:biliverdin-producing heme oxygenase [Glycomyces salinus]|uniref:biliverdin-producing heme oxygenase n=1 Tax=Glycomyces salinus TaxID=980294 RepID=UPI0018EDED92|nr:biliverdin-producing heme oxygenase [Glycomyces salinus]
MPADTTTTEDTAAPTFSTRIREASWSRHQSLDPTADDAPRRPGVFDRLFDRTLTLSDYTRWHAQQYFVYEAIEAAGERWREDPVAGPFVFDELLRLDAIAADLEFLIGPGWRTVIDPLPSTRRYVERVSEVATSWPGGYIAHSYTRYLGDLSGGQAFGKAARKSFGFDGPGAGFYEFGSIRDPKGFKDAYRSRLDALELDESERRRLIDEVLVAYDHNGAVLSELADGLDDGSNPFGPKSVAAICRHMNEDHPDDTLVICRGAGGRPEATAARMTGLDGDGGDYAVTAGGRDEPVRIPWARRLSERAEVRPEVVRLFTESQRLLRHAGQ